MAAQNGELRALGTKAMVRVRPSTWVVEAERNAKAATTRIAVTTPATTHLR